MQYFRAHFLQVHRRNNENRRVLYTHFTSVVVCVWLLIEQWFILVFVGYESNATYHWQRLVCSYCVGLVLNCYSARFDFQRLSAVGSTGVMDLWFVLMLVCNSYDISLCVNVEFLCTSCPHSFLFTLHLINSFITRGHMVIAVAAVILK